MKIWIDLTSMPHAMFFREFIRKAERKGNEVLLTCRKFHKLEELLNELGFDYICVGKHGKTPEEKLAKSSERIKKLSKIVNDFDPDICMAKHSVELPRVALGLGYPSILVVDHETAEAQMRLSVPLVDIVISPKATPRKILEKFGAKKIKQFYGVCEVAHYIGFKKKNILKELGISRNENLILARSEPRFSSHNIKSSYIFEILKNIKERMDVEIIGIPRNNFDLKEFKKLNALIPEKPIDALSAYFYVSLVISAGSTMNREAAIAGASVLSVCPDHLPSVDKFLIKLGLMHHEKNPTRATALACKLIENHNSNKNRVKKIVSQFENPYKLLNSSISEILKKN